ncbi:GGDEF domain-containing protein [Altererythrobacter sp. B11]|uniref:putative bifunctional diguanylate cyclase/phosphodiesterase n=1 Tax=Altererythrobacter sp. B11 TaxID=2060312 RepID=UPI000DC70F78|nr:EAL domain-containing protein [Altererythrobacter sp. B11]BBC72592.1 GGDEF domain-containing protein [Altererythrobacter sp. B11]
MAGNQSDLPTLPLRLSALEIIGLRDPEGGGGARLRALQYGEIHRMSRGRILGHGMAVLIVLGLYSHQVPLLELLLWAAALAAALWNSIRLDRRFADGAHRPLTRRAYRNQALAVVVLALVWSFALLHLVGHGDPGQRFALWALIAMLIAASAASNPGAPLNTILFAAITGAAGLASFLIHGEYGFATIVCAFLTVALSGTVNAARTYLSARIAEAGMAEKSEVVSLLLREFQENEADWLWRIDVNRRVRSASPRFAFALGSDPADIEGRALIELIAGPAWERGEFHPSLHDLAERLKRRESFSNLLMQVEIDGGHRWWELSGTPIYDGKGHFTGYRGVGSDVTEQRESDEKIAYLARYDTLTGLPNRLMLTEALAEALRYADHWKTRCAFLMIDLDRFKSVNDSLGHLVGDRLLGQVSQRLQALAADNAKCGRLGGDEFAIVIRDASDLSCVDRIARKVIHDLSQPYQVDNHLLFIGASIGSAVGLRDGSTVETLMRNADLALYQAKDQGGGTHCTYEPALHAHAEERRRLELSLRQAEERSELLLHYQPVVDAADGRVVSFEALLRWNSQEHGLVSPGKFIPLAEDTRLIVPIGEWVLREACREAAAWPGAVKVAVNVSGEQLLEPGFSSQVVRALADSGLPASRLEVEVTESIFLRDPRLAREALEEIMALGCAVALDDFGTGYSSLGYLRALRFSTIKVDRSFVQGAAQGSRESLAIINAVVAMARSLDMATTAEGAETEEEVALIRRLGCSKIQGYFFGRPMPAADARALLARGARVAAA